MDVESISVLHYLCLLVSIKLLNNYTYMNVQFIFTFFLIDELLSDCNMHEVPIFCWIYRIFNSNNFK